MNAPISEVTREKPSLTNLYNARPTWLELAHKRLDAAVFAAYGWKSDLSDEEILEKLLSLGSLRFASGVLRKFGEGVVMNMLGEEVFIMKMSLVKDGESVIITGGSSVR